MEESYINSAYVAGAGSSPARCWLLFVSVYPLPCCTRSFLAHVINGFQTTDPVLHIAGAFIRACSSLSAEDLDSLSWLASSLQLFWLPVIRRQIVITLLGNDLINWPLPGTCRYLQDGIRTTKDMCRSMKICGLIYYVIKKKIYVLICRDPRLRSCGNLLLDVTAGTTFVSWLHERKGTGLGARKRIG